MQGQEILEGNKFITESMNELELERVQKGQKYWKQVVPREKYPKGGYVNNDIIDYFIDSIVKDVWKKAKQFYTEILCQKEK